MMDLLEIEVEIVKISNYQGSALASVAFKTLCQCQKCVPKSPQKSSCFRERVVAWLLSHLLPQKLLCWQAC